MTPEELAPEIVARVLAGDVNAFGALVLRHEVGIRAYMAVRLDDPHEAEDLAQEVFLIAFRKLGDFDVARPMSAWLRGIAANVLRNRLRKREAAPAESPELLEQGAARLEEERGGGPLAQALQQCLDHLEPRARELVERRYGRGDSVGDICRDLQRQHSAVTMALHRIRQQLRQCIQRRLTPAGGGA